MAAVKAEKEQAVKEARDAAYKEGYREGCLDEKNKNEKTLNDEIVRLEAKKEEALKRGGDEGRREGYFEGCREAKDKYLVSFDCALCGKTIEVVTEEQKSIVRGACKTVSLGPRRVRSQGEGKAATRRSWKAETGGSKEGTCRQMRD
jgi:hypothetical protein